MQKIKWKSTRGKYTGKLMCNLLIKTQDQEATKKIIDKKEITDKFI